MSKVFGLGRSKHPIPVPMAIGIEPKQYEFECPCGYIWIDCQNTGCPMCGEEVGITAKPYDIKQPNRSAKHNS